MQDFLKLQQETIASVTALLKSYAGVECIFIMGSHTTAEASAFSDVDIGFVFTDSSRPHREEIFNQVAAIHPALSVLWLFDQQGLFLYENGVRLDLDFLTSEVVNEWGLSGVDVVYDPKGIYQPRSELPPGERDPAPRPRWRDEDGDIIDWFFWMFRQAYCYIKRGESNPKRSFNKLYSAQTSLSEIRAKLLEMRVYLHGHWDYMQVIDSDFADSMSATYSDMQPGNMAKATRRLFDLYEITARAYCEKTSIAFPAVKATAMQALFDAFDAAG